MEEAMKESMQQMNQSAMIEARADMMISPLTNFSDRFEAVMTDMLESRHSTQIEPDDPGMYRETIDNNDDEDPQDF